MTNERLKMAKRVIVLLLALLFFGGIGYSLLSVTAQRVARESQLPEKVFSRATPTQEDFPKTAPKPKPQPLTAKQKQRAEYLKKQYKKRLAAWKKAGRKGKMPTPVIAPGTMGTVPLPYFVSSSNNPSITTPGDTWFVLDGSDLIASSSQSDGWSVNPSSESQVSPPLDAVHGIYAVWWPQSTEGNGPWYWGEFVVGDFSVEVTTADAEYCENEAVLFTSTVTGTYTGPLQRQWSTGETTETLLVNPPHAGTSVSRSCTVIDGNDRSASDSHSVDILKIPVVTVTVSPEEFTEATMVNVSASVDPPDAAGNWTLLPLGAPTNPGRSFLMMINEPGEYPFTYEASNECGTGTATGTCFADIELDGGEGGSGGGGSGGTPPTAPADGNGHPPGEGTGGGFNPWPPGGETGGPPIPVQPPSGPQPPGTVPPPSGSNPPITITPPTAPGEPPMIVVPPTTPPGEVGGEIDIPGVGTVPVVIIVVPPGGTYWNGEEYKPDNGVNHCCIDGYIYDAGLKACVKGSKEERVLALTWIRPLQNATLKYIEKLRFFVTDPGAGITLPKIIINNGLMELIPTLISGLPAKGYYEASLDTRLIAPGSGQLKAQVTGSNNQVISATRDVTFAQQLSDAVWYLQLPKTANAAAPLAGHEFHQVLLLHQNERVSSHPALQYWIQNAVTSDASKLVDWKSLTLTPAQKKAAFEELQKVTLAALQPGQNRLTPNYDVPGGAATWQGQYAETPSLEPAGERAFWVQSWTPRQFITARETQCEYVAQIAPLGDHGNGQYLVFARNSDGSGAKVWALNKTAWTLKRDLAHEDYGAADAFSVALFPPDATSGQALFVMRPAEVFYIDFDNGQVSVNLYPRKETRAPISVAVVGSSLIWVFADSNLSTQKTQAYEYAPGAATPKWTLNDACNFAQSVRHIETTTQGSSSTQSVTEKLYVVCGTKLYISSDGKAAPTLSNTFASPITAVGPNLAGLQNGEVWRFANNAWSRVTTVAEAATAPEATRGVLALCDRLDVFSEDGIRRGVAGYDGADDDSAQLVEELKENGAVVWSNARTIKAPTNAPGIVSRITALCEYVEKISDAVGTPGQEGYKEAKYRRVMMIGTGGPDAATGGELVLVEESELSTASGALRVTNTSHYRFEAYTRPKPVEA
jgi:hypothetical protein